ncbi:unnamed protein product [Fraxinus pennsylvanica]|uniref:Ribosomal protein L34Ae n=1 Tax=Fraxinus pennsylvanica TaxID=56036 RepID=A0AAD2AIB1_9LAMI|nr:unnamed protein product [Fraxinus pennsylvanica]
MQCPKETIARLFYNVSSSFLLLSFFFYFTSIFLAKLFIFLGGNPFSRRNQVYGYEFFVSSDEEMEMEMEMEEENEYYGTDQPYEIKDNLMANISETLRFVAEEDQISEGKNLDSEESFESIDEHEEVFKEEVLVEDTDTSSEANDDNNPTSEFGINLVANSENHQDPFCVPEKYGREIVEDEQKTEINFKQEEDFLVFQPPKSMSKKLIQEKEEEDIFGDTLTIGSTSKDSSEWRSSINYRDQSGTDDPFSSSSRRSCPKWESYTVFQKYDEEMLFLDRISAQKLHETESLRSIQACPRSISDRIVHKLSTKNKYLSEFDHNPYHELEVAYVAQICLTWEALNWNYKYFQRLRASRRDPDPGCPALIAQQFQQFQVLLQRYIENEPYENGRRSEIYARMRKFAPKLLQVPEYRDYLEEKREEGFSSRISSNSFLDIMEESIRTFMNFLKADRESHCQIFAALFKRNSSGLVDATLLLLQKKVNKKKKAKLNELRRSRTCLRKRRLRAEEEMEILMALIDLKVVSRVLRMKDLNDEQLHWCENKMSKVKVYDGKLQRDSSPLFFPAH